MAEETSEYSGTADDAIGRFGEMSMDAQIAEASGISGIVECVTELPEPSKAVHNLGKTYQLIAVQPPYVMGRFYKCVESESSYSWRDVSEVQVLDRDVSPEEFFSLNGNEVQFTWDTLEEDLTFIKTEIQLAHLDATGTVKSVKTIFTEPAKTESDDDTESDEESSLNSAVVIVDRYTADGIAQGKIKLRVLSTFVGRMYICDLPKVEPI